MYGVGYDSVLEFIRGAVAIFLMGGVIKLMDDFLDLRYDIFEGVETLATRLGEGTVSYSLLGFALAVQLDSAVAASLMVAAYSVGMAGDFDRQLPSGLYGYQEGALVVALGIWFLPWHTVIWAVSVMLAVQIFDDLHDLAPDRRSGNPNLARRIGIVEAQMLGFAAVAASALFDPIGTALVFMCVPLVAWIVGRAARPTVRSRGWVR